MGIHFYFAVLSSILFYLASFSANAAEISSPSPSHDPLSPLLNSFKNIRPANIACRKEDMKENLVVPIVPMSRKPDWSCAVTSDQTQILIDNPDVLLIDTRKKSDYEYGHIDRSLNLEEDEIRTKRYFQKKTLILLGDGKSDLNLFSLCSDLKADGFINTRVLRGGLISWILDEKVITGVTKVFQDSIALAPSELYQQSKMFGNRIFLLSGGKKLADVFPGGNRIVGDDFGSIKNSIRNEKGNGASRNIILVADEKYDKSQLKSLAKLAAPDTLLVYSDTEFVYRQFIRGQNILWEKKEKGPTKPICGAI